MSTRIIVATVIAALFVSVGAFGQTGPIPNPTQLPQLPGSQVPMRPQDPGRPLTPQSTLPVRSFATSDLRCAADLASATQRLNATLSVQPNPVTGNLAQIDVLIDGVSQGAQSLRIQNGAVTVDRSIALRGAEGRHQAVFVLDGVVRSESRSFSHACVGQTRSRAPAPGFIQQQTQFTFVAMVRDGLRQGSELKLELETTDGRSFEFVKRDGIPDNSVLRIEAEVPLVLGPNTLHRVRLYIDDAPLQGFERVADAGDSASFSWMLIETGAGQAPRARIFQTGQIDLTIPPEEWWQTQVLSMRRVRSDTPVTQIAVNILTGADDLRVGPLRPEYHSVVEVVTPVQLSVVEGATVQSELVFGRWTDAEIQSYMGRRPIGIPPALTSAEEARLIAPSSAAEVRALRIQRMNRAFLMTREGIHPTDGARQPRPFGTQGVASTRANMPPGTTLRDIGGLFVRVDLGVAGSPFDNRGVGQASVHADQWDFGGVSILYRSGDGEWRILYSDKHRERVSANRTFHLLVPEQTLRE